MSLIGDVFNAATQLPPTPEEAMPPRSAVTGVARLDFGGEGSGRTRLGKSMDDEKARQIATAYRCANILGDDVGGMPLQTFHRFRGNVSRIYPDGLLRNTAYLVEMQPNRWTIPFYFKKFVVDCLTWRGNAYIWTPPGLYREMFILSPDTTSPVFDELGNKWYQTKFPNRDEDYIPDVEMVHLMINSRDGFVGRSVLTYARETFGRQKGAHETQDDISSNGLNPAAALTVKGQTTPETRKAVKKAYLEAAQGGVVVLDENVIKFDPITMHPSDAQFLEGIQVTDGEIANFFGVPLYKLNLGKQSYESNEQQDLEYLKSTLNPFLVMWEQSGNLKWFSEADQPFNYLKFNRDALLQTDAKTRTEILKGKVQSGLLSPNEARGIDEMNGYPGGDAYYLPANVARILPDGSVEVKGGGNGTNAGN